MDAVLFNKLLDVKEKAIKCSDRELTDLFKDYVKEVQKLWRAVDTLETRQESG
jgi:hypothetical protein